MNSAGCPVKDIRPNVLSQGLRQRLATQLDSSDEAVERERFAAIDIIVRLNGLYVFAGRKRIVPRGHVVAAGDADPAARGFPEPAPTSYSRMLTTRSSSRLVKPWVVANVLVWM